MAKARTVVGLDVHATKIVAAVLDVETGELSRFAMRLPVSTLRRSSGWRLAVKRFALGLAAAQGVTAAPGHPRCGSEVGPEARVVSAGGCEQALERGVARGVVDVVVLPDAPDHAHQARPRIRIACWWVQPRARARS